MCAASKGKRTAATEGFLECGTRAAHPAKPRSIRGGRRVAHPLIEHMTAVAGWVEPSKTQHLRLGFAMGFALLNPSYNRDAVIGTGAIE